MAVIGEGRPRVRNTELLRCTYNGWGYGIDRLAKTKAAGGAQCAERTAHALYSA